MLTSPRLLLEPKSLLPQESFTPSTESSKNVDGTMTTKPVEKVPPLSPTGEEDRDFVSPFIEPPSQGGLSQVPEFD